MGQLLKDAAIGISISDSPDLAELGLGQRHLEDAMTRVARHLLAAGARLVYGGDLREGGFTEMLFEFIAMHWRQQSRRQITPVVNVLAWPVHASMDRRALSSRVEKLESLGKVTFLGPEGAEMPKIQALKEPRRDPSSTEWAVGLTTLRKRLARKCDARIVLGGRVDGYRGVMPGIAEEALLSIGAQKPTYIIGGFGGCARDILVAMGIDVVRVSSRVPRWPGLDRFRSLHSRDLHTGLGLDLGMRLAKSRHIDEIVALVLRGLARQTTKS